MVATEKHREKVSDMAYRQGNMKNSIIRGVGSNARHAVASALAALFAAAAPFDAPAARVDVPPMPASPYADTEASTNFPFSLGGGCAREVAIRFAGCSPSNCIQVAFGRDADGDGALGADEAETVYGWRRGRLFAEGVADGARVEDGGAAAGSFEVRIKLRNGGALRRFSATNELGAAVLTSLPSSARSWLWRPGWDMARVTRRGVGVPAEWFSCDSSGRVFTIGLR